MNAEEPRSIEDRVRTATRAGATLVRDIGPMVADPRRFASAAARRDRCAACSPGESRSPPRPPSSCSR